MNTSTRILWGRSITVPFLRMVARTSAGISSGETAISLQRLFHCDPDSYRARLNYLWLLMNTREKEEIEESVLFWDECRKAGLQDISEFGKNSISV